MRRNRLALALALPCVFALPASARPQGQSGDQIVVECRSDLLRDHRGPLVSVVGVLPGVVNLSAT